MSAELEVKEDNDEGPGADGGVTPHDDREPETVKEAVPWMNKRYAFVMRSQKACVFDLKAAESERSDLSRRINPFIMLPDFMAKFENKKVKGEDEKGNEVLLPIAPVWRNSRYRRQYESVEFRPDISVEKARALGILNRWQGFAVEPSEKGSWSMLRELWHEHVCAGNAEQFRYQFGWFAHHIQKRDHRDRPGVSLWFRGPKGSGKNTIIDAVGRLWGRHYKAIDKAVHLTGKHNDHLETSTLIHLVEANWLKSREDEGTLKALITDDTIPIEPKFFTRYECANYLSIAGSSNADWVVPCSPDERRYAVFDVPDHKYVRDDVFFGRLKAELRAGGYERLLWDLMHYDLDGLNLRRMPNTTALADQKRMSSDPVTAWLWQVCDEGSFPGHTLQEDKSTDLAKREVRQAIEARGVSLDPVWLSRTLSKYGINPNSRNLYVFPPLSTLRKTLEASVNAKHTKS